LWIRKNRTIAGFDLGGAIIDHADIKIRLARGLGCELKIE